MNNYKEKEQNLISGPKTPRINTGDTNIEDTGNHILKISELVVSEVKEKLQKGGEEIRTERISEVEKERITIMKDLINASKEEIDKN